MYFCTPTKQIKPENETVTNHLLKLTILVHIGELIRQTLKAKRKTVVWFAKELSCSRTNVYKIFSKPSIDTNDLVRISKILKYNFFEPFSKELEKIK